MGPVSEDDDSLIELARFEGMYKDGLKTGYGKIIYPTGDIYQGEWFENKVHHVNSFSSSICQFPVFTKHISNFMPFFQFAWLDAG
jgi:MORN repeat